MLKSSTAVYLLVAASSLMLASYQPVDAVADAADADAASARALANPDAPATNLFAVAPPPHMLLTSRVSSTPSKR